MENIKNLFIKYREIIMYLIMGFATTAVNWVVYAVSVSLFNFKNDNISIFIANVLAWVCGVLFAFITNKLFVFQSYSWKPDYVLRELVLFVLARSATGVLEIFGVPILVALGLNQKIFGIDGMVSKLLVSVIVVILNYVFSKLIIFKDNKKEVAESN